MMFGQLVFSCEPTTYTENRLHKHIQNGLFTIDLGFRFALCWWRMSMSLCR